MNAVIYARYSSAGQTEQSIEGQLRDDYDFANRENITIVGEYIDRAMTGRNDDRDSFQRMIADAASKQFQAIIVWKLDRFARNRYDSAIYKAKLKKYGVKVLSAKENITDTPEGIILEGMLEAMAEYYSADLSVKVKRGQRESIMKGHYIGGHVPYGYRSVDGHLVKDEKTAPIIKYVFEEYAKGRSKKDIIAELQSRGVKSPDGDPLTLNTFAYALKKTIYYGEYTWNGHVVTGCADPIITKETYDKVQQIMAQHKHKPASNQKMPPYLLQGKIFCGHCGASMVGESGRSSTGAVYQYYSCTNRKKHHTCTKRNEKKAQIEQYVVDQTIAYILQPDNIASIARNVVQQYKKEFGTDAVTDLERQITKCDHDIDKLMDTLLDAPKSMHPRIYAKMEAIEQNKSALQLDLSKIRIASSVQITESSIASFIRSFLTDDPTSPDYHQRIIDTFVSRIYVYDDRYEIYYNTTPTPTKTPPPPQSSSEPSKSSNSIAHGTPITMTSEPRLIYVSDIFGIIIPR